MKKEDFEKDLELLSLDEFEENEFMLNTPSSEKKDIFDTALDLFKEDNVVDTTSEQDFITGIEFDEENNNEKPINIDFLNDELLSLEEPIVLPNKLDEKKSEDILPKNDDEIIDIDNIILNDTKCDDILEVPDEYNKEENFKPIKVKRSKEEREAYVLSTLKEIKKIKDEIIVELKLKKLSAEVGISYKELKGRLDNLPKPRKRRETPNDDEVMAEEKKEEVIETNLGKKPKKKEDKEVNKKVLYSQIAFCIISVIFILGCIIFYGSRLIKYYKIYNPKAENGDKVSLLGTSITSNEKVVTEGSGLYKTGSSYEFKGDDVNNYLTFNNQIFRILRINGDGSVDIALNGNSSELMWNSEFTAYDKSDIYSYLNNEYIKKLDKNMITNINYCEDLVDDLSKITCDKNNTNSFVRLLSITDYLNSKIDSKTFLGDDNLWLYNTSKDKVWHTNSGSLSSSDANETYFIKPVIRLKNSVALLKGTGTKENPYSISKDNKTAELGSNVKLGDDMWVVTNIDNDLIYLAKKENINTTYRFDLVSNVYDPNSANSVAQYLNNGFYNSLSYKDVIEEAKYYTGSYNGSYKDIIKSNIKAHVGMLTMLDNRSDLINDNYFLMTGAEEGYVYYFSSGMMMKSKITLARSIKPVIAIKANKLKSGSGSEKDPYVMEG